MRSFIYRLKQDYVVYFHRFEICTQMYDNNLALEDDKKSEINEDFLI